MANVFSAPLWIFALVIAVAAPFFVRALQTVLETQLRRRTELVVARAGLLEHTSPRQDEKGAALQDSPGETQKNG